MTLASEVTNRYSSQFMVQISNPQSSASTVVDTDRLNLACTDVAADFEVYGAGEFDVSDAKHVRIAVERVVALLQLRNGHASEEARTRLDQTRLDIQSLRQVQHADKVAPTTARTATAGTLVNRFPRSAIRDTKPSTPHAGASDNANP